MFWPSRIGSRCQGKGRFDSFESWRAAAIIPACYSGSERQPVRGPDTHYLVFLPPCLHSFPRLTEGSVLVFQAKVGCFLGTSCSDVGARAGGLSSLPTGTFSPFRDLLLSVIYSLNCRQNPGRREGPVRVSGSVSVQGISELRRLRLQLFPFKEMIAFAM